MNNAQSLRIALLANAAFSLTNAGFMIFAPVAVGEVLGVQAKLVFPSVGIGLVIFAADLLHQATRQRMATWRSLYASAADFLWVLATGIWLICFPHALYSVGNYVVIGVAAVVLGFGLLQLWSIGLVHRLPTGEYRHCIPVQVNVPADAMWCVISRLGDIQDYAPSLKRSQILDEKPSGMGVVRLCENHAGQRWSEECTAFDASDRSLMLRFVAEAPDFPFPVHSMRGGWEVIPSDHGCQVIVWWELMPKPSYLASIILPLLAFQADRDVPQIIHCMAVDAMGSLVESIGSAKPQAIARLLPNFC